MRSPIPLSLSSYFEIFQPMLEIRISQEGDSCSQETCPLRRTTYILGENDLKLVDQLNTGGTYAVDQWNMADWKYSCILV